MFLTLNEYLIGARKMLNKYGYSIHKNDDDAIAFVAHYMMKADETWDGISSSRNTWRYNRAFYAILKLKTKHKKSRKFVSLSTPIQQKSGKTVFLADLIEDKDRSYLEDYDILIKKASKVLTQRQFNFIIDYYCNGMTLEQIGQENNITRERVRQIISKAVNELKSKIDNSSY